MKKVIHLFFSFLLIFGNTSLHFSILTACADSSEDNTFSYIINADDSITITGIYENKEKIIIPSQYQGKSVKKIDDYAFWNNDCIKSVELSDGIEEIGVSAFGYCTSLSNVVLPANTFIYHDAFRNCPELTSIIIPREVKLEEHIVNEKNAYTVFGYLDLPVSAGSSAVVEQKNQIFTIYGYTDTAAEVYANENGFTFIPLDEQPTTTTTTEPIVTTTTVSTTTVSTNAEGSQYYENWGWNYDNGTLRIFGENATPDINPLEDLVDKEEENLPYYYKYFSKITSLIVENGIKKIGDYGFCDLDYLESITLPDSLATIGEQSFSSTGVTEVIIPKYVQTIEKNAFIGCWQLKFAYIMCKDVDIQEHAFGYKNDFNNDKYEDFIIYGYVDSTAESYANKNGFTFIPLDEQPTTTTTTEPIVTTTTASTTTVTTDEITTETDVQQTTVPTTTNTTDTITTESSTVATVTTTGTGTTLPQTGYSKWYQVIAGLAACMTGIGGAMVIGCGKLKKKKR